MCRTTKPLEPEFEGPIENVTVPLGRDVKLPCRVKHLGSHKVAWIFLESSAILTVQTHVITRNPRISATHEEHKTWNLHISNIQENDTGRYSCQINTPIVKTQVGYLKVVVPPSIDDSLSSSDTIVKEGHDVTLNCHAMGSPQPRVTWKREDGGRMTLNRTHSTYEADGYTLEIVKISRLDMGIYVCIASNGIPPAISKRIQVSVDFPPTIWVAHQLIGAMVGMSVVFECHLEAHPAAIHYWTREDGHVLHDQGRYKFEAIQAQNDKKDHRGRPGTTITYKTHMKLTIKYVTPKDFGTYRCVAKNPRGETDGQIKLYEIPSPTTSTTTTEKSELQEIEEVTEVISTKQPWQLQVFDDRTGYHQPSHQSEKQMILGQPDLSSSENISSTSSYLVLSFAIAVVRCYSFV
ncbi:lachesin-like isoform X2 [Artemia franciscana]|uniref:lachesin-like isoform X2 n=1 Tax=Artemia franciscana TaxID=6661 RepID=UPI0032DA7A5B